MKKIQGINTEAVAAFPSNSLIVHIVARRLLDLLDTLEPGLLRVWCVSLTGIDRVAPAGGRGGRRPGYIDNILLERVPLLPRYLEVLMIIPFLPRWHLRITARLAHREVRARLA